MLNEEKAIDLAVDYKKTFETDHGQRVLQDIILRGNLFNSTFDPDPHQSAFNEGKRYLALLVYGAAEKDIAQLKDHLRKIKQQNSEDYYA